MIDATLRSPDYVRRRTVWAPVLLAATAALLGLVSIVVPAAAAEPSSVQGTSSTAPPSSAGPTPTTHSYDDTHTGEQPEGASPALWILAGAVAGLIAIAVVMLRAGKPPRHHLRRGP